MDSRHCEYSAVVPALPEQVFAFVDDHSRVSSHMSKVWETVVEPHLLVIGAYQMGVEIRPEKSGSRVRVFIDFEFPTGAATYWLGRLFGRMYAKWCVRQMLQGVVRHFEVPAASAA